MHRQSETRAGNHQRHTRTRNGSLPTQANHTARGARKQPPNQGAIHAASEDTTHTSNHIACHQCRKRRPARHPPRAQQVPSQRTHNYRRGAGASGRWSYCCSRWVQRLVVGPCIAYSLCSRVASVDVVVPAPAILCFAPLSIVTAVACVYAYCMLHSCKPDAGQHQDDM